MFNKIFQGNHLALDILDIKRYKFHFLDSSRVIQIIYYPSNDMNNEIFCYSFTGHMALFSIFKTILSL